MKTAVLLVGFLRTWDETKSNFLETFGKDTDVFVSTYDKRYGYHPFVWNLVSDKTDTIFNKKQINQLFEDVNVKKLNIEISEQVDAFNQQMNNNFHPQFEKRADYFGQYRKFKIAVDLMKQYEEECGVKYDTVIKTRADIIHNPIILDNLDLSKQVLTDSTNVQPNDCFIASSRDNMISISDFMYNEFFTPKFTTSTNKPPHGMLENAFNYLGLQNVTQHIMNIVCRKGMHQRY